MRAAAVLACMALVGTPALAQETIKVHAAGSLKAALTEAAAAFAKRPDGAKVDFAFGPSGLLKERLEKGEASDVFASANMAHPKALADAIRATNIADNVSPGPGIQFNAKGQNDKLKNSAIQNRGGKLVTVAPKGSTDAMPQLPMTPYDKR